MSEAIDSGDLVSVEDYLKGEKISPIRHELIGGRVFAMSGGSLVHNRISGNIFGALDEALHGGPCRAYISDVKVMVRTLADENFYYPDVVVTCDPGDSHDDFLEAPATIFEVLSPSTEEVDRNQKLFAYRSLASLEEYVLVSQTSREVTVVRRASGWKPKVLVGDDFKLKLSCGPTVLESRRIYRGVTF